MSEQQVFVSYSKEDEALVRRLVDFLEKRSQSSIRFFVAHRDLVPGELWEEQIFSQLREANLVLPIFSAKALESNWVLFEVGFARGCNIQVIPLALPGLTADSLPRPLGSLKGIDLHSADGLEKVIKTLNLVFHHNNPTAISSIEFQRVLWDSTIQGQVLTPVPSGLYHVLSMTSGSLLQREPVEINIDGEKMTATTAGWESTGFLAEGRYVGRFKYSRGSSPSDLGTHEFHWTGTEFFGRAQSDSNKWKNETLFWRPADSVP